jgi:peptidoglycan/xylan/chitin deacetylase (PgdA/CDA1 family)
MSGEETVVLAYHSVDLNDSVYTVSPREFIAQMDYLRKNYNVVPLERIVEYAGGRRDLSGREVAITFDDGYYDNFANAYPYLKKYKLPAAIFVRAGTVGKEMRLDGALLRMLDWDEIIEMSRHDVAIGAHTVNHPDLRSLDIAHARREIAGSKVEIEERIGKPVKYFAYPFARFSDEIANLVRSIGFSAGFGGDGMIQQGDYLFALNRINIDNSLPFFAFKARIDGGGRWYKNFQKLLRMLEMSHFRALRLSTSG